MGIDRRTFLQQAGLAWFTWGTTAAGINAWGNNSHLATLIQTYQQTLAAPTNRKLALLVGINRYPHNNQLNGCLTDVELQRELLIHRFGFNPQDILCLCDRQATRENIETAFIEHLGKQAQPDDVVVFHFSGYGGQIKMPLTLDTADKNINNQETFRLVNSFVPVDGVLAKKTTIANSILQETLLVLAQSLSTTKCTFILDTSFNTTPRSKHSSLKIRSIEEIADNPSPQELAFLEQLETDLTTKGLKPSKRLLSLPGVVLSASSNNQVAAERHWHGFSAGLFTHALTQHLWQITPSSKVQTVLAQTAATVEQVMGRQQKPTINNPDKSNLAYYLTTIDAPNALGVISKVNSNGSIEIKLLGLPANIIEYYGINSCLMVASNQLDNSLQLQIKSKEGLISKAQLLSPETDLPQVGQLVQEKLRILEPNIRLTLAVDLDLERIERVDATSAIANIAEVNSAIVSGEQNADCLLGKVHHESNSDTAISNTNSESQTFSYGLYTPGGMLIGQTTGLSEEAVKIAIERLQPQFNNLLAAKWLGLTDNDFSSRLKVNATLTTGEKKSAINLQTATSISEQSSPTTKSAFSSNSYNLNSNSTVPILIKGSEIQLTLANTDDHELYVILLGVDADSKIFALYTPSKPSTVEIEAQLNNMAIAPQTELMIPQADNSWKWKVSDTVGINTLYAIFAVKPFEQTLKALATQQNIKLDQQQVLNVVNPHVVLQAVMQDLHTASSVSSELLPSSDVYALDVNCWASLSFVYEVVNS
jgi:hypothetical protein